MFFYKNHIKQLQKYVPEINYLDIGSKGGVQGWFNLIKENLNTIPFDAESDEALFNFKGKKNFYLTEIETCSSLFKPNKELIFYEDELSRQKYTKKEIAVDTLSNKLKDFKNKIDLIKIDTQGSEYEIIEGGLDRISNDKPFLFLETWTYPYYENIKLFDEIIFLLRSINYEIYLTDISASARIDLTSKFKENFGQRRHTGFNLFMGPSLKYLSEINNEQDLIKKSFILFVHDLLSFSYKILENTKSDYKYSLEKIINKRIKYKLYYKLYRYLSFLKLKFFKNNNLFPLT